jgi:hypothetical protein
MICYNNHNGILTLKIATKFYALTANQNIRNGNPTPEE